MLRLRLAVPAAALAVLALAAGTAPLRAQDDVPLAPFDYSGLPIDPSVAEAVCQEAGGVWIAEQQGCVLATNLEVRVDYPVALAQHDFIAAALELYLREEREAIGQLAVESLPIGMPVTYSLYVDSEQFQHSDSVVSLKLNVSTYTGGAHPNTVFETFTFDLVEGRELEFYDIFRAEADPLAVIVPMVRDQLGGLMAEVDRDWVLRGTSMDAANYQDFVLTPDSIIFYFEPYQVGPYALGPQQVALPLASLADVLQPRFVP